MIDRELGEDTETFDREHLALLLRIGRILSSSLDIDRVLEALMDQVVAGIEAERGFIMLRGEDGGWKFRTARALDQQTVEGEDFTISRGIVLRVAEEGVPVLTSDAMQDARFHQQTSVGLYNLRSILCVPLSVQGRVQGVIYTDNRMEAGAFTAADRELLVAIAAQAAIALENAMLYEHLKEVHETSMDRARRELAQTQAQLIQTSKLAAVGQLAAGVAHEINNPLGAIALNLSGLKRALGDPALTRRLELMERALDRCRGIIERLLRFAHHAPAGAWDEVNLQEVLAESVGLLEPELKRLEIEVRVDCRPELAVLGDAGELSQLVLNLLLNARDALAAREQGRQILLRAWAEGEQVFLAIKDNGQGMDAEVQQRIFEPFFTTKEVGQGVGLGLSVSYRIVANLGGTIRVDSSPGQGATFLVGLPAAR